MPRVFDTFNIVDLDLDLVLILRGELADLHTHPIMESSSSHTTLASPRSATVDLIGFKLTVYYVCIVPPEP